jgi:hypothetical protein
VAAKLTVQNAEIKTAAVELKTLTVSGKQVTLAVFRQLREEPLIAEDGTLNGVPWGTVNYHPDKCGDAPDHAHVVWQRGTELLRSAVDPKPQFDLAPSASWFSSGDRFYSACVRAYLGGGTTYFGGDPLIRQKDPYHSDRLEVGQSLTVREHGLRVTLVMSDLAHEAASLFDSLPRLRESATEEQAKYPEATEQWRVSSRTLLASAEKRLPELLGELDAWLSDGMTVGDLFREFDSDVRNEVARRQRHRGQRQAIADLPQLFIAV